MSLKNSDEEENQKIIPAQRVSSRSIYFCRCSRAGIETDEQIENENMDSSSNLALENNYLSISPE